MSSTGGQIGSEVGFAGRTLTSAAIETRVRKLTRQSSTTKLTSEEITGYIQEVVREISERMYNLEADSSGTLSASSNTITVPTDMVLEESAIKMLYLSSVKLDPISYEEWRQGRIDGYAYNDGIIYINPTPDNDRSYRLYYYRYHTSNVTTLEFLDELKMAIVFGVCQKVYEDLEIDDRAIVMEQRFEKEMTKFSPQEFVATQIRTHSRM